MNFYNRDIRPGKVLIAEDDYFVSEMIKADLINAGYDIAGKASNGKEAVELTRQLSPDVVLMDIRMPEMDGIEASKIIMETCPTPIVILSAYDSRDILESAASAGVGAYLSKPLNALDLDKAILVASSRFNDIQALKKKNSQLEEVNELNRYLMKEIHHRVKNNFQLITAILNLQLESISDRKLIQILESSRDRINLLAILHSKLYESSDLVTMSMDVFIADLVDSLLEAYRYKCSDLKVDLDLASVVLDTKAAVSCGLIINEAMTNSLKYAFPDGEEDSHCFIGISLYRDSGMLRLKISDNGRGIDNPEILMDGDTLGMQLIRLLAESQLGGVLEFPQSEGFSMLISFSV